MKIEKYILNHSSLLKNQINKNHKLIKELILPKTQNFSNVSKDKTISVHDIINPRKNIAEILKDENELFIQLYTKTKKLYPTKVEETFKDLILQYQNNDYKIPDLSDKKNLFNQNPLLLVGRDLDQYYMYNDKHRKNDAKTKTKLCKKHINFIKKEMMCMEKVINNKNKLIHNQNQNNLKENNDKDNDLDIEKDIDKSEIDYKKDNVNYFLVESVWDKIKEQKLKQKSFKAFKKKREKLKKMNTNKNIKINKSADKLNNIQKEKTKIDSYNTFKKYCNNIKSINNKNNITNYKSINSNETKNIHSIETITTNKSESPIMKLRHNLFKNIKKKNNLFNNNEETNKLQKEINEIKNTLNNSKLIEKNIIIEPYNINKSYKKNSISYKTYYNSFHNFNDKANHSLTAKKRFPTILISYNTDKKLEENSIEKSVSAPKNPEKKKDEAISKKSKLDSLKIFELIKKKTLPFFTLNKLLKEKNPQKFLELLSKVDLKIFNRKEIEKLMKSFCERILGYNEKEIERIINIKRNDENIYRIIDKTIKKTKKNKFRYYGKYSLKINLEKVNNTIYDLKRKFIYGKTDYNYES